MTNDRRLIEDFLPIQAISAEALREKSVHEEHISTLHLWSARRPLAAAGRCLWRCFYPIRVMLSAPRTLYPPSERYSLKSTAARGGGSPKSVPRPVLRKTLLELMP